MKRLIGIVMSFLLSVNITLSNIALQKPTKLEALKILGFEYSYFDIDTNLPGGYITLKEISFFLSEFFRIYCKEDSYSMAYEEFLLQPEKQYSWKDDPKTMLEMLESIDSDTNKVIDYSEVNGVKKFVKNLYKKRYNIE